MNFKIIISKLDYCLHIKLAKVDSLEIFKLVFFILFYMNVLGNSQPSLTIDYYNLFCIMVIQQRSYLYYYY